MFNKNQIIKGTLVLTISSIISRILGFLYRIFLSNLIGAKGMGIFQLIFPVLTFCIALSCGGIQIAVSRFVAESKSRAQSFLVLISSIIMSLFLSLITCGCLYYFAGPVSIHIIKNSYCTELLKYASITIPLAALHSCISGYYLGLKKTFVPAWSSVLEQVIKLISLYILSIVWISNGISITPLIAVYSMILSELAGVSFCLIAICSEKKYAIKICALFSTMKKMFSVSYVLTLNRIMLTFLQCVEAILVPVVLVKSGLSMSDALSIYGILTGMAIPVITFPSAINSSVCTMILPTIAKANTSDDSSGVKRTTEVSIWFSLITGIFCIGIFVFYGDFIGTEIFGHPQAGDYIKILAWLCPFMYLSMTLGSILHGLGKTNTAFIHNVIGTAIRLGFLWFIVPEIGIIGYLWGLLISNLVTTALHGIYVSKFVNFKFSALNCIIKPTAWLFCSLAVGELIRFIFHFADYSGKVFHIFSAVVCALSICAVFAYFLFRDLREMK
ncbi:MAG: oligosaccharide flippase family protein [Eubacterium sp.]